MLDMVKVRFLLPREDENWPPAESEGLWGEPLGEDLYGIDNTPWFVRNLSQTVRVIARSNGPLSGDPAAVADAFEPLSVSCELMQQPVSTAAAFRRYLTDARR